MSYNVPADLKYSKEHEWVRIENGIAVIGITDFAIKELTDVTYVEVEDVDVVAVGDVFGAVESTKTASDLFSPLAGKIVEKNESLEDEPELLNKDSYENWVIKVEPSNLDGDLGNLMDAKAYEEYIKSLKE